MRIANVSVSGPLRRWHVARVEPIVLAPSVHRRANEMYKDTVVFVHWSGRLPIKRQRQLTVLGQRCLWQVVSQKVDMTFERRLQSVLGDGDFVTRRRCAKPIWLAVNDCDFDKRKKNDQDELIASILELEGSSKEHKRNWARLIQKICEVDPLTCPKCQGRMRILAFIEDEEIIKKILKHLGLWERKARPSPKTSAPQTNAHIDKSARPGATRLPIIGLDHVLF